MVKYLFNEKIQIITTKNFHIHLYRNNKKEYGEDVFDTILYFGWFIFCWD